jgi:hypothetical protein
VANAIRSLPAVETPMGNLSYNTEGDLEDQKIYVFQVKDGDWMQVYP